MRPARWRYLQKAISLTGTPYLWGGRARDGVDCFGLVAVALYEASDGFADIRKGWWTDRAWNELPDAAVPLPGDLVFYGGEGKDVSHVMVLLYPKHTAWCPTGLVLGASGGDSTTTSLERAMEQGAVVTVKPSIHYRSGFRGFRSVAEWLEP